MKSLIDRDGKIAENWYIAALSSEVSDSKPFGCVIYDQPIVLFRDEKNQVHALQDRCLHRGAMLSEGHCSKKGITCPYHGWTFDTEGHLRSIPSEGPENETKVRGAKAEWKIPSYFTHEREGVIWVWMGKSLPSPSEPSWHFPFFEDLRWTRYFMITDFENEVSHLAQNFMDVPHTVFVHDKWFREKKWMKVPYELEIGAGKVRAVYHKPSDTIGGLMRKIINPKGLPMDHTDVFIYPNLTRVDYRFGEHGFVINSQCTPITAFKTRVYTWIAYRGSFWSPILKPLFRFYTRKVIQQDVEIMRNQGHNLQKFSHTPQWRSTAADEIHLAIDRMRLQGSEGTLDLNAAVVKKEREFWI